MLNYVFVAIGGAFGAMTRYGIGAWISGKWTHSFPLHTFIINVSGAFLLGLLNVLLIDKLTLSPEMRLTVTVGFLGAYTTFSTFGYETIVLIKDGDILTALFYTFLSVTIGLLGVFLGMGAARYL